MPWIGARLLALVANSKAAYAIGAVLGDEPDDEDDALRALADAPLTTRLATRFLDEMKWIWQQAWGHF